MPLRSSVRPALPPQPGDDVADRYGTLSLWRVHLVEHPVLAAAVAGDAHESGREGAEWLIKRRGGRRAYQRRLLYKT